jgi:hypothetical protein
VSAENVTRVDEAASKVRRARRRYELSEEGPPSRRKLVLPDVPDGESEQRAWLTDVTARDPEHPIVDVRRFGAQGEEGIVRWDRRDAPRSDSSRRGGSTRRRSSSRR